MNSHGGEVGSQPDSLTRRVSRRNLARIVFWPLFLLAAATVARHHLVTRDGWNNNPLVVELRTRYHLSRLSSSNAVSAARSWNTLHNLYMRKWRALLIVARHFGDQRPVHFIVRSAAGGNGYNQYRFSAEPSPPPLAPHEVVRSCTTVGNALLAMAYNEPVAWRAPFKGDWQMWWADNMGVYPLSAAFGTGEVEARRGSR